MFKIEGRNDRELVAVLGMYGLGVYFKGKQDYIYYFSNVDCRIELSEATSLKELLRDSSRTPVYKGDTVTWGVGK